MPRAVTFISRAIRYNRRGLLFTMIRRASPLFGAVVFALAAAACGGGGSPRAEPTSAAPRPFAMGFSSLPRELNAGAYADALEFAGEHGDMVLIQRMLPWSDFLPGAQVSEDTAKNTASERDAVDRHHLELFFAIDVTDGATGRDRLVDLPPDMTGRRFDDASVRAAFLAYAEYVALNYKPRYLALGVEMNLYYEKNKDDFGNFRSLYREARAAVKRASPGTQVTVTWQYEDLLGVLPREDPHSAEWEILQSFEDDVDFVGISSYPSFRYQSAGAIPDRYYSQLRAFTRKPIALAEFGYASAPGQQDVNAGTEEDQTAYLRRVLRDAEVMPMAFIVWFAIWDPTYARGTAFSPFQSIGLLRDDDTEKPAWPFWDAAAKRPLAE